MGGKHWSHGTNPLQSVSKTLVYKFPYLSVSFKHWIKVDCGKKKKEKRKKRKKERPPSPRCNSCQEKRDYRNNDNGSQCERRLSFPNTYRVLKWKPNPDARPASYPKFPTTFSHSLLLIYISTKKIFCIKLYSILTNCTLHWAAHVCCRQRVKLGSVFNMTPCTVRATIKLAMSHSRSCR